MAIDPAWKARIVTSSALDAVKVPNSERVMPAFNLPQSGTPFAPRCLRTDLIEQLESDPESVDPAEMGPRLLAAVSAGGGHDLLPFAGQSAELVPDIVPAAELIARIVDETASVLERAARLATDRVAEV
jgi:nitronate monooxygenase/enoyl-[acyl-carrier protein] reductase II